MLGAIVGDIVGSPFEARPIKSRDFELLTPYSRFTDDTVLTVAVADWILNGGELQAMFHDYVDRYPSAGYGAYFLRWCMRRDNEPYNSWGNGSAMRVAPVGYVHDSLEEILAAAETSASVTHNHPDGIRGAQAVAGCIYLCRVGKTKAEVKSFVEDRIGYDLSRALDEIRPGYDFDLSCEGSVPESIVAFLESTDFESAIRNAISLGGDADTMACIAGGIAEPFYRGVPAAIADQAMSYLDDDLIEVIREFQDRFGIS
jgi:ADP-ribosylglycohydrolase